MDRPVSIFDRFFSHTRPIWKTSLVCGIVLGLPFLAALLDGSLAEFTQAGTWRTVLFAPAIALYVWLISPYMTIAGDQVVHTLRPLVDLDDGEFAARISQAEKVQPIQEYAAGLVGMLLGFAAIFADMDWEFSWVTLYWFLSTIIMYGILAWTIFIAVKSTRVKAALHRLPMKIDILNPEPFEAVGRQSLLLALVFIGGVTISLVFTYSPDRLDNLVFWVSNLLFVGFILLIFFLSMRPTHHVLEAEKKRVLEPVTRMVNEDFQELIQELSDGKNGTAMSAQITALLAYEERLQSARTWPYNVSILRTLFFSVFIPLMSILGRVAADLLFK